MISQDFENHADYRVQEYIQDTPTSLRTTNKALQLQLTVYKMPYLTLRTTISERSLNTRGRSAHEAEPERKRARQDVTVKRRQVRTNGRVVIPYSRRLRITTRLTLTRFLLAADCFGGKAASLNLESPATYRLDLRVLCAKRVPKILSRSASVVVGRVVSSAQLLGTLWALAPDLPRASRKLRLGCALRNAVGNALAFRACDLYSSSMGRRADMGCEARAARCFLTDQWPLFVEEIARNALDWVRRCCLVSLETGLGDFGLGSGSGF
ncbi:hypothetical protein GGR51DRAFT_564876 [Nemania sp. FL0031]|nr:hypothetical protein GGR51DRAFT_564876 [Nemania sp. FL0031]